VRAEDSLANAKSEKGKVKSEKY